LGDLLDPLQPWHTASSDDTMDLIALAEQELGEIAAILTSYAGNQGLWLF
jgi:hypothetical protein